MFRLEIDSKGHRFIADMIFSFVGNKAEVDQSQEENTIITNALHF